LRDTEVGDTMSRMRRGLACSIGALSLVAAWMAACGGDDDSSVGTEDASASDTSWTPGDVDTPDPVDAGSDASRSPCRGLRDETDLRCDDFDDGDLDLEKRGWTLEDGGSFQPPRIVADAGVPDVDAPTPPHLLEAVAEPTDAGLPRSVITDDVAVTKKTTTLEADVFVAEWTSGAYRVLRFDLAPTPQEHTGLTLDVLPDGKWRCIGYSTQALGNRTFTVGEWHHVKLTMKVDDTYVQAWCQVDDVVTAMIPGRQAESNRRRLEIGVTTYAPSTPRTRVLYDNIEFYAE